MKFGSKDVFDYILHNMSEINSDGVYDYIYEIVRSDALSVLSSFNNDLNDDDRGDIIQDVNVKIIHELSIFVKDSRSQNEASRNAWLKKMIKNRALDVIRKRKHISNVPWEEVESTLDIDPYDGTDDIIDQIIFDQKISNARSRLDKTIEALCSINTSPENVLSFLYNRALCIIYDNNTNGAPQKVVKMLNGKTLFEVFAIIKRTFRDVIGVQISDDAFRILEKRLHEINDENKLCGERVFFTNARTVTDSSSWIRRKLKGDK